jgi:UDP-glucose 4-epimerase
MGIFLVTGAAGFIGSALAEKLLYLGHRVITIDNLSTGNAGNIPDGVEFVEGDCQDKDIYKRIPQCKYDAIFHIAGQSSGEISFDDPTYDLRTNTESILHILQYAMSSDTKRIIYASTMSVYGKTDDYPVLEDHTTFPESFYGVGKLASENYLRIYENYGINSTSLRLFNVYGPGQNLTNMRQGMVSIFMSQMVEQQKIHIKGSPERYRDFIYIDDVVGSFLKCLGCEKSYGQVINIGTGVRTTIKELVDGMILLYEKDVATKYEGGTPGDIHGIYADINRAQERMNFRSQTDLEKGLIKMLNWVKEQYNDA